MIILSYEDTLIIQVLWISLKIIYSSHKCHYRCAEYLVNELDAIPRDEGCRKYFFHPPEAPPPLGLFASCELLRKKKHAYRCSSVELSPRLWVPLSVRSVVEFSVASLQISPTMSAIAILDECERRLEKLLLLLLMSWSLNKTTIALQANQNCSDYRSRVSRKAAESWVPRLSFQARCLLPLRVRSGEHLRLCRFSFFLSFIIAGIPS